MTAAATASPAGPAAADVLQRDGRSVTVRDAVPADQDGLLELVHGVSDRSSYLRYFCVGRASGEADVARVLRPGGPDDHAGVVTVTDGRISALGSYERIDDTTAEFAVLVDDRVHHDGLGTLLLEELGVRARRAGFTTMRADVLAENAAMLRVLRDFGADVAFRHSDPGTVAVSVDLTAVGLAAAVTAREQVADRASLDHVLAPRSVAVVGAGSDHSSPGRRILANILAGGFTGQVWAVNPHHRQLLGVRCHPTVADLPEVPDLVVVAVPGPAVASVVEQCGAVGVHGVVVVTAGFGETGTDGAVRQAEVVRSAREHGMRLIGPNCLGILNTDPAVRLNATFADLPLDAGSFALASQSGALGIAVAGAAHERGLDLAQFVSMGNKADVSGNDLLLSWSADPRVAVVGLYLESLGNPRRFVRIARHVAARTPVIAVKSGRTAAGVRAGQSHTAAAASADVVIDALFEQAGVIRVTSVEELLDTAHLLTTQPVPAGDRLGVIGNSGGPEILAVDAAAAAGLQVPELSEATRAALQKAVPSAASCNNPVDLGANVSPRELHRAIDLLVRSGEVDAVVVVHTRVSTTDPDKIAAALARSAATSPLPVAAVDVGEQGRTLLDPHGGRVPVYAFPEPAVAAMGRAARRHRIATTPVDAAVRPADVDVVTARHLVTTAAPGWLGPTEIGTLLRAYGIAAPRQVLVTDEDALVHAAQSIGWPVALKVVGPGIVHKADVGGVRLGVPDEPAAIAAFRSLAALPGATGVLVQPMVRPGVELIVGALQDATVGPVVMVGAGGTLADLVADRCLRLAPVAADEAARMLQALRTSPLLDGFRGGPVVSRAAVADLVRRVSHLVADLPQVAELDLNPVVARGEELLAVDARIRVAPPRPVPDGLSRALLTPPPVPTATP